MVKCHEIFFSKNTYNCLLIILQRSAKMKMNFVIFCKSEKLFVVNMEPKPLTNTELATKLRYSIVFVGSNLRIVRVPSP